jgi:hypothetical protein
MKPDKNKRKISVDSVGEEAEIKILNDVTGAGEISKSVSNAYVETIKGFRRGEKFFIIAMILALVPTVVIPFLKIEQYSTYRFDIILNGWFALIAIGILAHFIVDIIERKKK